MLLNFVVLSRLFGHQKKSENKNYHKRHVTVVLAAQVDHFGGNIFGI